MPLPKFLKARSDSHLNYVGSWKIKSVFVKGCGSIFELIITVELGVYANVAIVSRYSFLGWLE